MILTCDKCSTRYLVDPRALGAAGRLVRCAKCYHTWHQAPPGDAPLRLDVEAPSAEAEPSSVSTEDRVQLPALPGRRRRPWVAVGWLVLFLVVVGGAAAAGWKADEVMRIWPESARLYQWVGLVPSQPTDWYTIKNIEPRRDEENGVPRLVIQGELINNSAIAQEVPKLKVELRDAGERVVQSWTFTASTERLLPGASVPFTTSVAQPNEAATGVTVTLAGKDE